MTALAASGDGTVFVGGEFESAGGASRIDLAELDGAATRWSAGRYALDVINAIPVTRTRAGWAGGSRPTGAPHRTRSSTSTIATRASGSAPWRTRAGTWRALDTSHGAVQAVGSFTAIGSRPHLNLVSWTPRPALLNSPRALGTVADGETLTCTPGTWAGITTAYDSIWIAWPTPVNTAPPSIAGTGVAGSRLTCRQGTWTYAQWVQRVRWLRDGVEVGRGWSWTPQASDVGRAVRCEVTVSNGRTATALSAPLTITAPPPAPAPAAPAAPAPTPPAEAVVTKLSFVRTAIVRSGWANVAYVACSGACRATLSVRKARGGKRLGSARVVGTGSVYVKLKSVRRPTRAVIAVRVAGRTIERRVKLRPR